MHVNGKFKRHTLACHGSRWTGRHTVMTTILEISLPGHWMPAALPWEGNAIFLGSVKAAVNIEAVEVEYTTKISHVVTLCGNEIQVRGAPSDLPTYFERCGVAHIWWFIEDPTVKDPNTELAKHRQSAGECLAFWKDLMHVLWDVASYYWNHDIRFTPLFHCFGGINRSTAALCAWLVIWWDLSVEDAIDCVLQQRPSLRPWKRRAYVLYALRSLEHHKHAWRWEFETS